MNKVVTFRNMELNDIPAVAAIENLSFAIPWTPEAFERELTANEYAYYIVAEEANEVIGYCGMWLIVDESHITNIAIHPSCRGRKLGEQLLTYCMNQARLKGAKTMTLEVRVSNETAQNLYRKLGFLNGGIRKRYYTDNYEDALIMWVNL
ncbi:ribosomal protein S18-alanine N-acetyltransferase [Ectobacillus antri]|jgi:ribosomal-protein-alanine N-acetyltransferase|uniref:[Ribosomal protein bS18]-alanine N-acetyltransferase n=1 Tax=Ectobacillus antri TaxID=2486280 RepID=A0ABT6HA57_9BACI|nr:ribosomal protein S18-alanine N-acetyltransferase [Ectobacillus antri]MDG4658327.1 ribosomal protein S18-alanine N-acetyltransferase [Ectobacillus antri]MDG5755396.1 ribosomal protein S18-alanine N-acetyltransferase [Ectobacillus antri]